MINLIRQLQLGTSTMALVALSSLGASPAMAQQGDIETVTVTGSSIRGVAPIGANLITVSAAEIASSGAATMQDVVRGLPALSDMGGQPVGNLGNNYFSPNIHQLGHSASNSTLTLYDGVRFALGGTNHALPDPSMIPTIAIDRVDVLATGASSIYGADAVAGVVNFITRKSYDGLLVQGQFGVGDSYTKNSTGLLWGTHWADGNVMVALQYTYSSSLRTNSRPYLDADHTAQAIAQGLPVSATSPATNFNTFSCNPATIQMGGAGNIYMSAAATTSVANTPANSPCNTKNYDDILPLEMRKSGRVQLSQDFGDLTVSTAINYSYRLDHALQSRGVLTGTTVFSTGSQANPFYQRPAGYTGTATTEVIRWSADALLGPGATNNNGLGGGSTSDFMAHTSAVYHLGGDFDLTYDNVIGQDRTYSNTLDQLCQSCANLALNGTTQNSGNTTTVSVPGTTVLVTTLPLTTSNALDVWNPAGPSNRTSPAVIDALRLNNTLLTAFVSTVQHRMVLDGPLFELPAGPLRMAAGAEYLKYTDFNEGMAANNTGPSTNGSSARVYHFGRMIESAFLELNIPVIGPNFAIPFVQKLDFDLSIRHDSMSDVGHTTNPKYAVNWQINDDLTIKANYSTAFVPPPIISVGDATQHYAAPYAVITPNTGNLTIPVANFPQVAGALPGCAVGATTCQFTAATPGIGLNGGGGTDIHPARGDDWSLAAQWTPGFLPGFDLNVSYFNDKVKGLINSTNATTILTVKSRNNLITICPAGCSAAVVNNALSVGWPVSAPLPSTIYYITDNRQANVIYFNTDGIDLTANYGFDMDLGHVAIGQNLTQFMSFDYTAGEGGTYFSVLGTNGFTNGPTVATFATGHIGWIDPSDTYELTAYYSYSGGYHNWSANSITAISKDANGNPNGGGDPVKALLLFDVHAAYNFPEGMFGGDQIYLDVRNIFDKAPSYYNSAAGFSGNFGNPIGRLVSAGFRAKF